MRKQYHFRRSADGLLAWDVDRLVELASGCEPFDLPLTQIRELDETFWFDTEGDEPTCRRIALHAKLILQADLSYPIILSQDGRVMDGMHRACKALIEGKKTIRAVQLTEVPAPDYTDVRPDELPY